MEVIEVTEREIEVIEVIERGPQGPQGTGITILTTQGDLLYRGATTGERLPIGTTGQILKVSSGGIPEWGAAPSSGVSSVSGTSPIVSSGGSAPAISITAATTSAAGSMSAADKTKLDGIASGAEVNVNADWNASSGDAQILNKPTIPSTAADVGAVPASRTIFAGAGLTGGGDLSANRTLAVSYGTTAGTACQGNDARISGIESGSITIEGASIAAGNAGFSVTTNNGTGQINTSDGGSIDTSNGGGSINTCGTGSIEFGEVGTRTTLTGTATADRAISLPDAAGTLALTSDITKSAVGLGNVTNNAQTQAAIVPNTAPSAGQLLVGNAGGTAYAPATLSGDATIASTGALTLANTSTARTNIGLGNVPNVDTTNAANISSGVLPNARVNWAAPSALGSTTAAAATVTDLKADTLTMPKSGQPTILANVSSGNLSATGQISAATLTTATGGSVIVASGGALRLESGAAVVDPTDTTKKLALNLSGISSATTRTLTIPNGSGTIARTEDFAAPPAIGSTTASSVAATTLSASGTVSGTGFSNYLASPPAIGGTAANAITGTTGTFTTLSANNGTLTASAPVLDLSQTWNNAAVTFTGLRFNVTNTASLSTSNTLELQNNGTAVFFVRRTGGVIADSITCTSGGAYRFFANATTMFLQRDYAISWTNDPTAAGSSVTNDLILRRDAAGVLGQRDLANPQAYRIYNTTDAGLTNFERGFIGWSSNTLRIGTEKGGTGSARALEFQVNGNTEFRITTDPMIQILNSRDLTWQGRSRLRPDSTSGVLALLDDTGGNPSVRFCFNGFTSSFPALKRSSTTLQVRLADDSAYTVLDAQLRAQGTAPATSGAAGTAGDIRYDADYIYVCTAANTWKRAAIATW